ncbi:MAG: hypothetical protein ABMA01_17070 [Chthoniobacteraceae bacterium]
MNTPEPSNQVDDTKSRLPQRLHQRRAVALVLAVSFIVLLSALVVGFFSRVTTDLASSRSYAEGVTVRQLADSAVGVVMGQIREATALKNACWASQPGMIRTYRTTGGQPGTAAYAFYKLYSSQDLILTGAKEITAFDPTVTNSANAEVPLGKGGWQEQPAFFTDLNEPVDVPDPAGGANTKKTVKRYPIFDPSVAAIYDPGARPAKPWSEGKVEGCEVVLSKTDRFANDAPMPVRWIYVLKDGTLTAPPAGSEGLVADWKRATNSDGNKTGIPTKENPIVGRIAFWTDDDSCKVNINTAGGFLLPDGVDEDVNLNYTTPAAAGQKETNPGYYAGSFWDTPRVQTRFDRGLNNANAALYQGGLANSQPAQNEFQRYPGHPSTTSLGLVFRYLLPSGKTGFNSEKLYAMTPRLMPGGSLNGTRYLNVVADRPLDIKTSYDAAPNKTISYHLFASVDEFFWSTRNGPRISAVTGINDWAQTQTGEPPMQSNSITTRLVDQARFFVTANNRAPELNLFGRPRVTVWPVPSAAREQILKGNNIRNPTDDLLRFCSTVGRDPRPAKQEVSRQGEFIFERGDPYRSGWTNAGQDPKADFWQPRNQAIFNYLRELTSSAKGQIPGFGGNFETKYAGGPGGRDQILVEIFDYIRTVNQKDGSRDYEIDRKQAPKTELNNKLKTAARYAPHALSLPTRVTIDGRKLSGFGRYPTISEAALVFYHGGYICRPKANSPLAKFASGEIGEDSPSLAFPDGKGGNKGRLAIAPGGAEVVIYDVTLTPGDYDPATLLPNANATANLSLSSGWAQANVENWTGQIVRAFLLFETFTPAQGYAPFDNFANVSLSDTTTTGVDGKFPRYNYADPTRGVFVHVVEIKGQFTIQSTGSGGAKALNIGGGVPGGTLKNSYTLTSGNTWAGRDFGGTEGFFHTMQAAASNIASAIPSGASAVSSYYPFQSPCTNPLDGVRVGVADKAFDFVGGKIEL